MYVYNHARDNPYRVSSSEPNAMMGNPICSNDMGNHDQPCMLCSMLMCWPAEHGKPLCLYSVSGVMSEVQCGHQVQHTHTTRPHSTHSQCCPNSGTQCGTHWRWSCAQSSVHITHTPYTLTWYYPRYWPHLSATVPTHCAHTLLVYWCPPLGAVNVRQCRYWPAHSEYISLVVSVTECTNWPASCLLGLLVLAKVYQAVPCLVKDGHNSWHFVV